MKKIILIMLAGWFICTTACKENPKNTFGGPSNNPKDTAAAKRDTSSVGTRKN